MAGSFPSTPMDRMLSAVLEIVPDAILSGPGHGRALRWASQLPAFALESTFGFESRLDEDAARCDLFLSVQPRSRFSRHLIASGTSGTHSRATPSARGLGEVLADMAEPDGFLSRWFRTVILEYDLAASRAPETEPPGVFLEPHGSFLDPRADSTPSARGVTCGPRIMTSAICRAVGRATDPAEFRAMERVHRALPRTATTEHVGALPGRDRRAVRVVVAMPKTEVIPFLERVEWTGSMVHVERALRWLDRLRGAAETATLACDVSAQGVSTRLAFELFVRDRWHRGRPRFWAPMVGHFVENGWCTRAKATGLLSWPEGDYLLAETGVYRLLTGINHLKLVLHGDGIATKAYMGAFLLPR